MNIVDFIMKYWGIRDDALLKPNIIVPHGYGLISPHELPDASKKTLLEAIIIAKQFPTAKIAFTNSDYFWEDGARQENNLKLALMEKAKIHESQIIQAGTGNSTIEELNKINQYVQKIDEVVLIGDWMHTRRIKQIAPKLLSSKNIKIRSINGTWDSRHPSIFQKSETRWLLANIIHSIAFAIFGDRLDCFHHIIKNERTNH